MGMHNGEYWLSNSEMADWKVLCPRVWKAIHIDKVAEFAPSEAMQRGQWFETLAIGSGVRGQVYQPTEKQKKSVYNDRIISQSEDCKVYLEAMGGKVVAVQEYLYGEIVDADGQVIKICGGLDVRYRTANDEALIIDLKLSGDNDNDYGDFQWGNPDKIKPIQAVHYKILHKAVFDEEAAFQYWVFDTKPTMGQKIFPVIVSELAEAMHIEECSRIYNEITMAMALDDWDYVNTFENCRDCPVPCSHQRVMPDFIEITA